MNSDQGAPLTDHDYDGIQEFDNVLPAWWLYIFLGTIIFGFIYFIHYTTGSGPTQKQELQAAMNQLNLLKKNGPLYTEETLAALFDASAINRGHNVFQAKCVACHGLEGGGLIGPNLTDKSWIHGQGQRIDLVKVISEGVSDKGMPAWSEMMSENDVLDVASYVYSIKGSLVPGGKPPQGTEYP